MKKSALIAVTSAVVIVLGVSLYTVTAYAGWRNQPNFFFGMTNNWRSPNSPAGSGNMMGNYWSNFSYGSGMMYRNYSWIMQNYGSVMMYNHGIKKIQLSQTVDLMKVIPDYVSIFPSNDTIRFSGTGSSSNITIVAYTMGGDLAKNLTGAKELPSNSSDNVFVIFGIINPTMIIPKGTAVQMVVINLDDSDYHNLILTTQSPPYPSMPMMSQDSGMMGGGGGGMMYGSGNSSSSGVVLSMMPMLAPTDYKQGVSYAYGYSISLNNVGAIWYYCAYPGHAQSGMYGKILVSG